jgi:hypothetical protein
MAASFNCVRHFDLHERRDSKPHFDQDAFALLRKAP